MALEKARVQLLNPDTGAVVEEVDILSTASAISYVNNEKTIRDFRGIPAGTTFKEDDEISIKDVLDSILYPYEEMEIESIASIDGKPVSQDTVIYKEKYYPIDSFDFSAKIKVGKVSRLTFQLKRYNNVTGNVTNIESTVSVTPGSTYLYSQNVSDISDDTSLQLTINDGENITVSPTLEFKFIYPVYVGYCDLTQIIGTGDTGIEINTQNATDYFNTLIANKSNLIEKRLVPVQDIKSITITDPIYSNKEYYPCIIYPNTWHKVEAITDCNGNIITGAFYYNNKVSIKPDNNEVHKVQYTVYASINSYNVQLAAAKEITYNFELGTGSINYNTVGIPALTGFDSLNTHPLDLRLESNTYAELEEIKYKYDGMIVFVHDIQSYFRYDKTTDMWINTNQEILFGSEIPALALGKSGDVYINIASGHIYQKYKDIRWEDKGVITVNLSDDILKSVDIWQSSIEYEPGSYVYWNGKYWKCQYETNSEPGTDNTWVETKPTLIQGPEGKPGEAATVEIVETLVTTNPDEAEVINLGDKFHARLRFIVPRGPAGDAADPEILYNIQNAITNQNTEISAIKNDVVVIKSDIDEAKENDSTLRTDVDTIKSQINTINSKNEELNNTLNSTNTLVKDLQSKVSTIDLDTNKNFESLSSDISDLASKYDSKIRELDSHCTALDNGVNSVININKSQDTEIANIKDKISEVNGSIETISTHSNMNAVDIITLKGRLDNTETSINTIQEQIASLQNNVSGSTENNTTLAQSISDINTKIDAILADIENIKKSIPASTVQEGTTLKFNNSSNTTLFETTVANGIPIMVNGKLDYTNAKTAYLVQEDDKDFYVLDFE